MSPSATRTNDAGATDSGATDTSASRRSSRSRAPGRDAVCMAAEDVARAAAEDVAGAGQVGEHVDATVEGERLVTHLFASLTPGYRGWHWAVSVTRAPRAKHVTVNEVVLLPGREALLAPDWVPWSERVRPGDLGVGDLLPTEADDPRLAPAYSGADEDLVDPSVGGGLIVYELGLGRARVLSREGRDEAADRWYFGDRGPNAPLAKAAPAQCSSCGFYQPLAGALGRVFGVCANDMSPSDGSVVSADHGCGAHSEAVVVPAAVAHETPILDDSSYEVVSVRPEPHSKGSVDASATEDLGHS